MHYVPIHFYRVAVRSCTHLILSFVRSILCATVDKQYGMANLLMARYMHIGIEVQFSTRKREIV